MLHFSKYQGTGNDFVVLDRREGGDPLSAEQARFLCDRHRGVGADGVLSLWADDGVDGRMQIQNADGSEAGMCGNGLRCMARFLYDLDGVPPESEVVELRVGESLYRCERVSGEQFRVQMGRAVVEHAELPEAGWHGQELSIEVDGKVFTGTCHYFGNPHFSVFTEGDPMAQARLYGPLLEVHPCFSNRANVSFSRGVDGGFETVVFERGVGITQACGTGACAVGASAVRRGLWNAGESLEVNLPGGRLTLEVDDGYCIVMQGDARLVFKGVVEKL